MGPDFRQDDGASPRSGSSVRLVNKQIPRLAVEIGTDRVERLESDALHPAERVRFQWFYYGRLPSRETLHFEEYRRVDGHLTFLTDYPTGPSPALQECSLAVQLHSVP